MYVYKRISMFSKFSIKIMVNFTISNKRSDFSQNGNMSMVCSWLKCFKGSSLLTRPPTNLCAGPAYTLSLYHASNPEFCVISQIYGLSPFARAVPSIWNPLYAPWNTLPWMLHPTHKYESNTINYPYSWGNWSQCGYSRASGGLHLLQKDTYNVKSFGVLLALKIKARNFSNFNFNSGVQES